MDLKEAAKQQQKASSNPNTPGEEKGMEIPGIDPDVTPNAIHHNSSQESEGEDDDIEPEDDPKLIEITERNRHIADEFIPQKGTQKSAPSTYEDPTFGEPHWDHSDPSHVVVSFTYGLTKDSTTTFHETLAPAQADSQTSLSPSSAPSSPTREEAEYFPPSRSYLIATDLTPGSVYAVQWACGTLLRNGDTVHIVQVLSNDDDVEKIRHDTATKQLIRTTAEALVVNARHILGDMLLYDITCVVHAIAGRVKDSLTHLIDTLPLTVVIVGSRGLKPLKTFTMGSISTFLVHNSSVPVTVVRWHKQKVGTRHKVSEAHSLSQSVKQGSLKVDELSGASRQHA
ncbi:hypothetical protein BZG36_03229 [Bifiguratus adelaidae]|uniref:UspA domain-containing protein n=1 Tax=Bifiguratus adelaidae TaxID=1938954 RepID=A0A261XWW5_9FUNG|nr:hypothetical protein BZG36_03229 [Bifiguratus adelaidae]